MSEARDAAVQAWVDAGFNVTQAAKTLGRSRGTIQEHLDNAFNDNDPRVTANRYSQAGQKSKADMLAQARLELRLRSERKSAKGDWRKPSYIMQVMQPVFMLGIFGDPHLDNSGTDIEAFEEEAARRDPSQGIYTACVGDFFDNWVGMLGKLYAESGDPEPAWWLFEHIMDTSPFLFSVSGNHDLWNTGTVNFLEQFFRERGALLRRSGGRFILGPGERPITVAMRHIWKGNSQYSEAHSLKRAATFGFTDDDIICGGHTHKGETRRHIRPHDGRVQNLVQVSSFKRLDNFANDRGFMSAETPPIVWLVCDVREPLASFNRVQSFYDFDTALAVKRHQEQRNG